MRYPYRSCGGCQSHGMNPIDCYRGRAGSSRWDSLFPEGKTSCPQ
nr:MAG TPA: hypothetical protein [Caudoviricetes sp.]